MKSRVRLVIGQGTSEKFQVVNLLLTSGTIFDNLLTFIFSLSTFWVLLILTSENGLSAADWWHYFENC